MAKTSEQNKIACKRWYQKHKQEHLDYVKQMNEETEEKMREIKGTICEICGAESPNRIILHRKDGKPHKIAYYFYKSEIKKNQLNDYLRLCYRCHIMIHWIIHILKERTEEQQDKIVELAKLGC